MQYPLQWSWLTLSDDVSIILRHGTWNYWILPVNNLIWATVNNYEHPLFSPKLPFCLCTLISDLDLFSFVLFLWNIFTKYHRKSLANCGNHQQRISACAVYTRWINMIKRTWKICSYTNHVQLVPIVLPLQNMCDYVWYESKLFYIIYENCLISNLVHFTSLKIVCINLLKPWAKYKLTSFGDTSDQDGSQALWILVQGQPTHG